MTAKEKIIAAGSRQQQILDASRAAGNENLTADEQREFDAQQAVIDALRDIDTTDESASRSAAVQAENERVRSITELGRTFGMDVSEYVNNTEMTLDAARAAVLEKLGKNQRGISAGAVQVEDEVDRFRAAASDAFCMRAGVRVEKAAPGAQELRSRSLRDMARQSLIVDGRSAGEVFAMDDDNLLRSFYLPESSFPAILDASIRKSIVEAYKALPVTFEQFTTKGSLPDFKESKDREYLLGSFSEFKKVPENGELEMGTVDSKTMPTRKLDTYGRSFSMTRQAFLDDDIGFISALPAKFTKSAKMTIEKQVYDILFNNSKIFDGKTLFHADHKNLIGSGAKPSQAAIQAAITLGRKQTDPFGEAILWSPKCIIVPVGYEFDLAVIFKSAQVVGSGNNDINPLYNYPLTVVQSPVLNTLAGANACPWFISADPTTCGGIQVDYLNGQEMPTVRRMERPGTLGFHWDIYMDWGINVRDFRGFVKNPGEAL